MVTNIAHEVYERSIEVNRIKWNFDRHNVFIENRIIALTKTEFRLLYPLRTGLPVSYTELAFVVYNCSMDDKVREMLDKHIDRIRGKLRGSGMYVYCVKGYGYILFSENEASEQI